MRYYDGDNRPNKFLLDMEYINPDPFADAVAKFFGWEEVMNHVQAEG